MDASNYLALLGVAVILAVTPGPDTLLTLQYALRRRQAGILTGLGSASGIFVWAALVAAGAAALLQDSPVAFTTLRVLGGTYLVHLGYRALTTHARTAVTAPVPVAAAIAAGSPSGAAPAELRAQGAPPSSWTAFTAGIVSCLTNPKTGLFFLALIPQFTPSDAGPVYVVTVVGGTVGAVMGGYLVLVALGAHTAGVWLNRPSVTRWIHRLSGGVFIALGLMTALPAITSLL